MPIDAKNQEGRTPGQESDGREKPGTAFVETQWPEAGRSVTSDLNLDHLRTRLQILREKTAGMT